MSLIPLKSGFTLNFSPSSKRTLTMGNKDSMEIEEKSAYRIL
jgi:hypothetical protein